MDKVSFRINRIILFMALIVSAFLTAGLIKRSEAAEQIRIQQQIAQEVLRFHVLANSDSDEDQKIKLAVRDGVLEYLEKFMPETENVSGTKSWVRGHIDEIEEVSREIVDEFRRDEPVSAAVTTCWFPSKSYGDVNFPAGNYEALRIEIGEAKGHNWWCVLYPSLCFLDTTNAVLPEEGKQKLKNVLTEEEYARITMSSKFKIKWYFW